MGKININFIDDINANQLTIYQERGYFTLEIINLFSGNGLSIDISNDTAKKIAQIILDINESIEDKK